MRYGSDMSAQTENIIILIIILPRNYNYIDYHPKS